MVEAERRQRRLQRHVEVVDVGQHLEHRGEDARAARSADHHGHRAVPRQDRRRHRGQAAACAARWRWRRPPTTPYRLGVPRLGGEIVHLVIQEKARALDHHARSRTSRSGCRCWRRRCPAVDDRIVGGLRLLQARPDRARVDGAGRIDLGSAPRRCRPGRSARPTGTCHEIRVAQVLGAVGEHALFDLRHRGGCTGPSSAPRRGTARAASSFMCSICSRRDPAGARRRRGDHLEAAPFADHAARARPPCSRPDPPW